MFELARLTRPFAVLALGAALSATAAEAQTTYTDEEFERIASGMSAALDMHVANGDFAPGVTIAVVTTDGHRWVDARGVLNAETGAPATTTSQFYIASMTKSFMGLLAAHLDRQGILSLDSTLDDHWPGLQLPEGADATAITLRDLITHQIPIENGEITGTEANIRDLSPAEYRTYLETYSVPREPGFQYDNLGYNIYGAILEMETGRNWRDWLDDVIFDPNGMTGTSGRVSDFPAENVAWGHQMDSGIAPFWPMADGWALIHPKTDGMMQAAGGLMITGEDLATWLTMHLQQSGNGLSREDFVEAQTERVQQEGDGHGFTDDGYAYGWNTARLLHESPDADGNIPEPTHLLQHGGGYTGFSSVMTFSPELGLGIAIAMNADGPVNFSLLELTKQGFELALALPGTDERGQRRADYLSQLAERFRGYRQERMTNTLAEERFGPGGWAPDSATLQNFTGTYTSDGWLDELTITMEDGMLVGHVHDLMRYIQPVSEDIFAAYSDAANAAEYMHFYRNEDGTIERLVWDEDEFAPAH